MSGQYEYHHSSPPPKFILPKIQVSSCNSFSAKFRYFGISPTCQNPLVSPATLVISNFVNTITNYSNEKELPGLRNGRLRREGTSWTSKWTLETRRTSKWTLETRNEKELPGLRNGRLRQEGTSWTSKWTLETRRNAS
ncbi:unnamed protein product [Rhizophagus irregularis]|nr:unnamed protein product [Rhizophagus irregularis]